MKQVCIFIGLLLYLAQAVTNAQPSGIFTFEFGPATPIWDFTGSYPYSDSQRDLTITLNHLASGKIVGQANEVFDDGVSSFAGGGPITGRVQTTTTGPTIQFGYHGGYAGNVDGDPAQGSVTANALFRLNPSSRTLNGLVKQRTCVARYGCRSGSANIPLHLKNDMNGSWSLALTLASTANRLSGSATITLSNGRQAAFKVAGSYSPKSGVSNLRLTGLTEVIGSRLVIRCTGSEMHLTSASGRTLGQAVFFR